MSGRRCRRRDDRDHGGRISLARAAGGLAYVDRLLFPVHHLGLRFPFGALVDLLVLVRDLDSPGGLGLNFRGLARRLDERRLSARHHGGRTVQHEGAAQAEDRKTHHDARRHEDLARVPAGRLEAVICVLMRVIRRAFVERGGEVRIVIAVRLDFGVIFGVRGRNAAVGVVLRLVRAAQPWCGAIGAEAVPCDEKVVGEGLASGSTAPVAGEQRLERGRPARRSAPVRRGGRSGSGLPARPGSVSQAAFRYRSDRRRSGASLIRSCAEPPLADLERSRPALHN